MSLPLVKIVVFGEQRRVGALVGDTVVDLNGVDELLPSTLEGLIAGGDLALARVRAVIDDSVFGESPWAVQPLSQTVLHAPTVYRPRLGSAAGNYAEHTAGSARRKGAAGMASLEGIAHGGPTATAEEIVEGRRARGPRGFWKDTVDPVGPGGSIPLPARSEKFDYEGEVVVVLGSAAKDVPAGKGGSYIWGVTLMNDWSIRGTSVKDSLSFNLGKNFDGAASLGPCIVVGDIDPANLAVQTHVNGELRQDYNSGDMIFSHADFIEYLSRDFTLLPGDMISGGSGPGSATDSTGVFLEVGDVVEVSSPEIGVLSNTVVAKP